MNCSRNVGKKSSTFKRSAKKGLSVTLAAAMLTSGLSYGAVTTKVQAAEPTTNYAAFTEDEVVLNLVAGNTLTADAYSAEKQYGFADVEFNNAAKGWSGNIYYPRVAKNSEGASYVSLVDGALKVSSKVWTETESTGYGVYTYENTSPLCFDLPNADYKVTVTLTNPTSNAYNAYVEAEDITKVSNIDVPASGTKEVEFTACLVDGKLNLKFLGTSAATTEAGAVLQDVYVSNVKITRLATNEAYENNGVKKPTIFIASDSTVQSYEAYYNPQTGWGQVLADFFGDGQYTEVTSKNAGYSQSKTYEVSNAVVENRAIGGRSSSSFVTEGKLDDLLEDVAPGDFLLIQWGHNDATYSRPNRYVSATADFDENGVADFEQWIQYYIDGAVQRGATPVLVTPVARYSYTTDSEGKLISYASNFEAYRQVMIRMSKEQGIALVDLTQRSIDIANDFGIDGGKSLWLYTNAGDYVGAYAGGSTDSTHLQWYGAYKFAQAVAQGIVEAGNSSVYTNENNASEANKAALAQLASLIDLRAATAVPSQVTGLTEGTVGASSIAMSWTEAANTELYYVYRAEVENEEAAANFVFDEHEKKYSVSRGTKFVDTACESGKTYVYAIRGFNSLGLSEYSENIVVTTKAAGLRFDFNYNNSATQLGWTGVNQNQMYDKALGYGWLKAPNNGRSRGNNGTVSDDLADMAGDFNLGEGEFAVDLPNGDYEVTIYAADLLSGTSTIKPSYNAEGAAFGGISCKQSLGSVTGQVRVTDGQLNVVVGGTNQYINGITITEILKAPTGLAESEASVTNGKYTALLAFNPIAEAAGYNYYIKGTTDTEFHLERTFDKEKFDLGVTEYGAISVNLGEDYQYYVTCYTSDGTESAPSNIITVKALLGTVEAPKAPTNVTCVSPAVDASGVQNSITISWDAAAVADNAYPVTKYIVYRSDKAEGSKGFVGFEKVGETTETSFTDNSEGLATNVHYYYKIVASNAGGAGEYSIACETPVTGQLAKANEELLTDRALVAVKLSDTVKAYDTNGNEITEGVYVSYRAFEEEFDANNNLTTTFTIKVNGEVVQTGLKATNLVLTGVPDGAKITVEGSADASINGGLKAIATPAWDNQYMELQLVKPVDQTMPDGSVCNFTANDMSLGDIDGDGVLELIVKWYPSNAQDNSKGGYTGTTIIDAYDVDWATGDTKLVSRVDLGVNIRSGAHYTQFQVWDFDGDGKAELAVKTADGTTAYVNTAEGLKETGFVGACNAASLPTDTVSPKNDYRNASGYVLSGPEYFSMINLEDGSILDTVAYTPGRGTVSKWGDAYGNRVDRFLSATAYLDGVHPFAVMGRGYYTRTALTAYGTKDTDNDGIGDSIYQLWAYDTDNGDGPEGQGNHNLSVADVDNDGKDEILYGSSCYDHDGTLKYSTGMGHGDAMHVSDWIATNPGLEVMEVHEEWNQRYQVEIHDAETGEVITGYPVKDTDVGRGVAADIDPTSVGAEFWASNGPSGEGTGEWDSTDASVIGTTGSSTTEWNVLSYGVSPSVNAMIYWDGDLLAEVQDHVFNNKNGNYFPVASFIAKWNYLQNKQENILYTEEVYTSNGTKGNFGIIADFLGDWREEFIARCSADDSKVRVYTTTYVTDYVIPCFLDDLQYREGVAWENVAYNQPAHTSYFISKGLVTAALSQGESTPHSINVQFTPANDGDLYGHKVEAYKIYRDGELIATVPVSKLGATVNENEAPEVVAPTEPVAPVKFEKKFDFGAGAVAEGYTQVKADAAYNAEAGYGFTSIDGLSDKTYKNWNDDENAALFNDAVLGWIANGSSEFVVDVPNGTYDVTYYIANGSGAVYDAVTAEGVAFADVRRGNTDIQATKETVTAVVTDGQLNIVNTVSKSGYAALYFTAIEITENADAFAAREAAYETAKAEYDAYVAGQAAKNEEVSEPTVDPNYGVVKREFKYDFGAGEVAEGYTQVKADAVYSANAGYGFVENATAGNATTGIVNEDVDAALISDNVTFYDKATDHKEFVIDLPNGKYTLTYVVAGNNVYNAVTAEGQSIETNKFRFGAAGGSAVVTTDVEVTDGQLNLVATLSKSGYFNIIFSSISVVETDASFEARVAEAKAAYEAEQAKNEVVNGNGNYVYADKNLASNTEYSYQIAAVVNGRDSFLSKPFTAKTLIAIESVAPVKDVEIVAGTKYTESVAELLPSTVTVTDTDGNEQTTTIKWNVEGLDTTTVGEYIVTGTVEGFDEPITVTVQVTENEMTGFEKFSDVKVIATSNYTLPTTVKIQYSNGTEENASVTWDTSSVDVNTMGEYTVYGTVNGYETKAEIKVVVVADYPVSVDTTSIECTVGNKISTALPETVMAKMASGNTAPVAVTWKLDGVDAIDTSVPSQQMIHGTVENLDVDVLCDVNVTYAALYKFDFGISNSVAADGWTTVTVNAKGGKKTASDLGVQYTEEKGFGFADASAVIEGRTETVTGNAVYPTNVVTDFALMTGQTFVVDVENGKYLVQVMTNCGIGSTSATVDVEGTTQSMSANKNFTVKDYTVEVTDGQLTIADKSSLARIGAIVIRKIAEAETEEPSEEQPSEEQPSENPSQDPVVDPSEEQPSEEQPSEEQPSEEQPSEEQPSEEPTQPTQPTQPEQPTQPAAPSQPAVSAPAAPHVHVEGDTWLYDHTLSREGNALRHKACSVCGESMSYEIVPANAVPNSDSYTAQVEADSAAVNPAKPSEVEADANIVTAQKYVVVAGDNMSAIARKYGITLAQLIGLNPQVKNPSLIMPGLELNIGAGAAAPSSQAAPVVAPFEVVDYIVKSGEFMFKIARDHGMTIDELINVNPQVKNPSLIFPGDVLKIKK